MAKIWMSGGGEGADLDAITAKAEDTLKPKIYINEYGDPAEGTMPDKRIVDPTIGSINSGYPNVAIHKVENIGSIQMSDTTVSKEKLLAIPPPPGYYYQNYVGAPLDKVASVTGVTKEKILYNQTACGIAGTATNDANAVAADIRVGTSAYAKGVKIPGSMPDFSKKPSAIDAIRINNNRFEVAVARGFHGYSWADNGYEYMSYDQVANAIGLTPAKLKKGEVVCGRTGTFEGWVPTANDLYVRGNNIAGFIHTIYGRVNYEAGGMQLLSDSNNRGACLHELSAGNIDYTKYNYLNIEGYYERRGIILPSERNLKFNIRIKDSASGQALLAEAFNVMPANYTNFTTSLYIGPLALSRSSYIDLGVSGEYYYSGNDGNYWQSFNMSGWLGWVYRIWLS